LLQRVYLCLKMDSLLPERVGAGKRQYSTDCNTLSCGCRGCHVTPKSRRRCSSSRLGTELYCHCSSACAASLRQCMPIR
jgi:hypothetical protein